jgi:hypothetical protein
MRRFGRTLTDGKYLSSLRANLDKQLAKSPFSSRRVFYRATINSKCRQLFVGADESFKRSDPGHKCRDGMCARGGP